MNIYVLYYSGGDGGVYKTYQEAEDEKLLCEEDNEDSGWPRQYNIESFTI